VQIDHKLRECCPTTRKFFVEKILVSIGHDSSESKGSSLTGVAAAILSAHSETAKQRKETRVVISR
jgi:hypothetical protein